MKKCVFVLGMHRSGTSLVSASLCNVFKLSPGKNVMASAGENPKGYFENDSVVSLNDKVLSEMGLSWASFGGDPSVFDDITQMAERATRMVFDSEYTEDKIFIKDPRLCYMYPIWENVVPLDYEIKRILVLRQPEQVAKSLMKRITGVDRQKAMKMWHWHIECAVKHAPMLVVTMDDMLDSPEQTIRRIGEYIGEELSDIDRFIDGFIDTKLRHYTDESTSKLYNKLSQLKEIT